MTTSIIKRETFKDNPLLCRLLELHAVPDALYIQGKLPEVTLDEYGRLLPRILTIVGSRKNTSYGKHVLETFIQGLQGYPILILSGLALGIDGLAHKAAIENNLTTIAIPGSGLDKKVLYPSAHQELAKNIVGYDGALISLLEDTTPAAQWTFPERNRIMAALSDAVLVIEAEDKSGTLITARQALELGRDIGAVPGDIFSPTAFGTNMLIHEGAYPITSSLDILSLLHLSDTKKDGDISSQKEFEGDEKIIMDHLREPVDKDTLFAQTELSFERFLTAFSSLEMNGFVQETFGEVRRLV